MNIGGNMRYLRITGVLLAALLTWLVQQKALLMIR